MQMSAACQHCGSVVAHQGKCPLVKAIEYFPNGMVKRVEYLTPADYYAPVVPAPPTYSLPQNPIPVTPITLVDRTK